MASQSHVEYERSDINIRGVVFAAIALTVVMLISIGLVTGLFVYLRHAATRAEDPLPMPKEVRLPPEPRIQRDPEGALREMRVEESRILDDYRWVDKEAGIARIPIDRAMKAMLERGLLASKPPTKQPTTEQPRD